MTIEYSALSKNFEQNNLLEVEQKFIALDSSKFDRLKPYADNITQIYLSHPDDEYSLRLRQQTNHSGEVQYTATLKDRGEIAPEGLRRMEVEAAISAETFHHYLNQGNQPVVHKQRAELCEGVSIDWIEGSQTPIIEVENADLHQPASDFLSTFSDDLIERTGHGDVDNESIAYAMFEGKIERPDSATTEEIINDLLVHRSAGIQKLVIGIGGRSGSGKSTLARELQQAIAEHPLLGEASTLVSTDDYHRGRHYLESTYRSPWTNWEDAKVYDTELLGQEIANWHKGQPLSKRYFDFATEESVVGETLPMSNILIVEGIHASSSDLTKQRHLYYEVKTPLSVSLGRDIKRLIDTDRSQAAMKSPEERLRYILEIGELTYREQVDQEPKNKPFSGCSRSTIGATALSSALAE